ncbi:MAG: ATP synthase F0 subunit C [Ignavibacteria bacterium]|jgi:F-type H+-transporting ATPase subunit c|nr:ATP synthase F0 subunit C [Ignavibacteria bacterium]
MESLAIAYLAAAIGAGLVVIGASIGISRIGAAALEAIGRQPEAGGQLRTSMIIAAALIEGVAFFAAAICLLLVLK